MTTVIVTTSRARLEKLYKQGKIASMLIGRDKETHRIAALVELKGLSITETVRLNKQRVSIPITRFVPYYSCSYSKVVQGE